MEQNLTVKIRSNKQIHTNYYHIVLDAPFIARNAVPGQFVMVRGWRTTQPFFNRPFSIHRVRGENIEILYKVLGEATYQISKLKRGDTMMVIGPLGNGFKIFKNCNTLLVAGGMGSAPLLFLSEILSKNSNSITLFIGAKTKGKLLCILDFKKIKNTVIPCTEDGSLGEKCFVTNNLKVFLKKNAPSVIYACGPNAMLREVSKIADLKNIPCYISLETVMGCGIGTCLGCAIKTKKGTALVCKDGPVFNSKEIF
ncbi:hypothetical protein B9J78_04485 [bacterium Unc6]|nr:hypothetical protein [bacterium Unc6]